MDVLEEHERPEHDKLRKVSGDSNVIGQFLDWLQDEKSVLFRVYGPCEEFCPNFCCENGTITSPSSFNDARVGDTCKTCNGNGVISVDREHNVSWTTQDILAEYFDIDQKALEKEKRQMLNDIRKAQGID